jgi:hypothetical protein
MSTPSGKGLGKAKNLPKEIDLAVQLIASLTGEDPGKISELPSGEIITYLSKLLNLKKELVANLLREHNQTQELDLVNLAHLWKLVNKGVVKDNKQKFGSISDSAYTLLKFIASQKVRDADLRAKNTSTPTSETTIPNTIDKITSRVMLPDAVLQRLFSFSQKLTHSNDNSTPAVGK